MEFYKMFSRENSSQSSEELDKDNSYYDYDNDMQSWFLDIEKDQELRSACPQDENFKFDGKSVQMEDLIRNEKGDGPRYLSIQDISILCRQLNQRKYSMQRFMKSGGESDVFGGVTFKKNEEQYQIMKCVFRIIKSEDIEELIQQQNKIMSLKDCVGIVQHFDVFQAFLNYHQTAQVIAMEECQQSMQEFLDKSKKNGFLTQSQVLRIAVNLFASLIQLNISNIIHLDIKPQNILINQSGDYVLADFGLSQYAGENIQVRGATSYFSPPEISEIEGIPISFAADVFQLGKTFEIVLEYVEDSEFKQSFQMFIKHYMINRNPLKRASCWKLYPIFLSSVKINSEVLETNIINFLIQLFQKQVSAQSSGPKNKFIQSYQQGIVYLLISKPAHLNNL